MKKGKVYLTGAGPHDPGLLTVKGKQILEQADCVLYDRLVSPGIRALIPPEAEGIDVGKKAGTHPVPQEEINRLLLEKALEGKTVVRLKGGDPFVFGRGGEELELLKKHGIPYEIIPGVTAGTAVPAYAGIPVTHRDMAHSLHFITAHRKKGEESDLDYDTLAKLSGTLVFYMGAAALPEICRGLLAAGKAPDTPAALLSCGTSAAQKRVTATLRDLPELAEKAALPTPSLILVGETASLSEKYSWTEGRPLEGRRIFITRPRKRSGYLAEKLAEAGAEVILLPTIETRPIPLSEEEETGLREAGRYPWIAFTSAEGVACFRKAFRERGLDVRLLGGCRFAAIGPATKEALEDWGIFGCEMPEEYTGRALGRLLAGLMKPGEELLLPRAKAGTREVLAPLEKAGISYREIRLYDTFLLPKPEALSEVSVTEEDLVTFTSASTVKGFAAMFPGQDLSRVLAVCIGPRTAEEAAACGMRTVTADRADAEGVLAKIMEFQERE